MYGSIWKNDVVLFDCRSGLHKTLLDYLCSCYTCASWSHATRAHLLGTFQSTCLYPPISTSKLSSAWGLHYFGIRLLGCFGLAQPTKTQSLTCSAYLPAACANLAFIIVARSHLSRPLLRRFEVGTILGTRFRLESASKPRGQRGYSLRPRRIVLLTGPFATA